MDWANNGGEMFVAEAAAKGRERIVPNIVARNAISRVCVIPRTAGLHIQSVSRLQGGYAHEALSDKTEKSGGQASLVIINRLENISPNPINEISRW
tara:strand:+ start:383 stop:670 length:288 start_codon:yes stop_codon:yes gene_type:complete